MTSEDNGGNNAKLARFLYCLGEKLRGSEKLDEDDEVFLGQMVRDNTYDALLTHGCNRMALQMMTEWTIHGNRG